MAYPSRYYDMQQAVMRDVGFSVRTGLCPVCRIRRSGTWPDTGNAASPAAQTRALSNGYPSKQQKRKPTMPSTLTGSYTNPHPILIRLQDEIYWLVNYDVDGYITLDNAYSHKLHAVYMDNPHYENIVSQIERQRIYYAILCERAYQDRKYGTPTERMLDIPDYIEIMRNELDEAAAALAEGNPEHALCELLQATTVGIACIEFHGLIERPETQSPNHPIP